MRRNSRSRAPYIANPYGQVKTREEAFRVLGLSPDATEEEIKRAFRQAAKKYHPDVNPGDARAEENFKLAGSAYEILSTKPPPAPIPAQQTRRKAASHPSAPHEAEDVQQPRNVNWTRLIPDLPLGQAIGFLGIRADGMVDVYTKYIYKTSTPSLERGVHVLYEFIKGQPVEAEKVASKHFVIVGREREKNFKFITFPKLAAMVGYMPSSRAPHSPYGEGPMDPDDFE